MKKVIWETDCAEDEKKQFWEPFILGKKPDDRVYRTGEEWIIVDRPRDSIIARGRVIDVKAVRRVKWLVRPVDWQAIGVSQEQLTAFEAAILELDATNEDTPKEGEVEVSGLHLISPPVREFVAYWKAICIGRAIVVEEEGCRMTDATHRFLESRLFRDLDEIRVDSDSFGTIILFRSDGKICLRWYWSKCTKCTDGVLERHTIGHVVALMATMAVPRSVDRRKAIRVMRERLEEIIAERPCCKPVPLPIWPEPPQGQYIPERDAIK